MQTNGADEEGKKREELLNIIFSLSQNRTDLSLQTALLLLDHQVSSIG